MYPENEIESEKLPLRVRKEIETKISRTTMVCQQNTVTAEMFDCGQSFNIGTETNSKERIKWHLHQPQLHRQLMPA